MIEITNIIVVNMLSGARLEKQFEADIQFLAQKLYQMQSDNGQFTIQGTKNKKSIFALWLGCDDSDDLKKTLPITMQSRYGFTGVTKSVCFPFSLQTGISLGNNRINRNIKLDQDNILYKLAAIPEYKIAQHVFGSFDEEHYRKEKAEQLRLMFFVSLMTRRFHILVQNNEYYEQYHYYPQSNNNYAKQQLEALQKCWAYAFTKGYYKHKISDSVAKYDDSSRTYTFAFHFLYQNCDINAFKNKYISSTDFKEIKKFNETIAVITKPSWFQNIRLSDNSWNAFQRIIAGKSVEFEHLTPLQMLQDTLYNQLQSLCSTAYYCISNLLYTPVYIFNSLCSLLGYDTHAYDGTGRG